jgi:hypothetical protein
LPLFSSIICCIFSYQDLTHSKRPSNEIQTTIDLLFKEKEEGLYTQDFARVDGLTPRIRKIHPLTLCI